MVIETVVLLSLWIFDGGDRKIDPNRPNSFIESVDSFSVQMPSAKSRPEPDTKNRTCQCYSENKIDSTNLDAVSFKHTIICISFSSARSIRFFI